MESSLPLGIVVARLPGTGLSLTLPIFPSPSLRSLPGPTNLGSLPGTSSAAAPGSTGGCWVAAPPMPATAEVPGDEILPGG